MSEIVTLARSSSSSVRSHGFPVLETGNLAFPNGRYVVDFQPGADRSSFSLTHRVEGAPLIPRLIEEKQAQYVCAVSSPVSSYRRTHRSPISPHEIRWDENDLGEPPLFTPMIVCMASRDLRLDRERDGVHEIWHGKRVRIEKGNRLAVGRVVHLKSSILHLLSFHADESLGDGTFFVVDETEEGFRFRVNLNPKLHAFLQHAGKDGARRGDIMIHIVTACLSLLQREYSDDSGDEGGWRSHGNLSAFADFLEGRNLLHWSDDEFRPERVATSLYPHLPKEHDDGEDET